MGLRQFVRVLRERDRSVADSVAVRVVSLDGEQAEADADGGVVTGFAVQTPVLDELVRGFPCNNRNRFAVHKTDYCTNSTSISTTRTHESVRSPLYTMLSRLVSGEISFLVVIRSRRSTTRIFWPAGTTSSR